MRQVLPEVGSEPGRMGVSGNMRGRPRHVAQAPASGRSSLTRCGRENTFPTLWRIYRKTPTRHGPTRFKPISSKGQLCSLRPSQPPTDVGNFECVHVKLVQEPCVSPEVRAFTLGGGETGLEMIRSVCEDKALAGCGRRWEPAEPWGDSPVPGTLLHLPCPAAQDRR